MIVPNGAVATELVRRGNKLARLLLDGRFRAGLCHGVAATIEHEAALAGRDFASVVDIGANRGQFTLLCAGLYPNARIFAFEPLPGPYAILARIMARQPRIRTHQAAIGPHAGPVRMHVMHPDDCSSLLAPTAMQTAIFRGSEESGVATVALAPLDVFVSARELEAPSLLKVDVQGYELEALKGCAGLLDRFAAVYVEGSFERLYADQALADEVLAHLAERGFGLRGVYNAVCDGPAEPCRRIFCARDGEPRPARAPAGAADQRHFHPAPHCVMSSAHQGRSRMKTRPMCARIGALLLSFLIAACAGQPELAPASSAARGPSEPYRIGAGDTLKVFVWGNPGLSDEVPVRPDGRVSIPLLEDVEAAGRTPTELGREIEEQLSAFVADPLVTVIVTDFVGALSEQVRVVGEALEPSAIPYRDDMTLLDVMIEVGGLTEFAAGNQSTLVRTADGQEQQYRVRLDDLVRDGDISANVAMRPGDVVIIPETFF